MRGLLEVIIMASIPTIEVYALSDPERKLILNESDFDESKYGRWGEPPKSGKSKSVAADDAANSESGTRNRSSGSSAKGKL